MRGSKTVAGEMLNTIYAPYRTYMNVLKTTYMLFFQSIYVVKKSIYVRVDDIYDHVIYVGFDKYHVVFDTIYVV